MKQTYQIVYAMRNVYLLDLCHSTIAIDLYWYDNTIWHQERNLHHRGLWLLRPEVVGVRARYMHHDE